MTQRAIDNNIPAFSMPASFDQSGSQCTWSEPGMSLRDYVATAVLQGLMANPERYKYIAVQVEQNGMSQEEATAKNVNKAFLIADAFLDQRASTKDKGDGE